MALFAKLALAGLAVGLVVVGLALWLESRALTNPPGYAQPDPTTFSFAETPRTAAGLDFSEIEAATPGGEKVRGWLVPAAGDAKDLAVLALHGRGGDRRSGLPVTPALHERGAAVAMIDFRENGLSDGAGRGIGLGMREAEDAVAAAAELRRRGYRNVVLLGCSLGGSAAILAAAQDPTIDGVIAESPVVDFSTFEGDMAAIRLARRGISLPEWAKSAWGNAVIAVTRPRIGLKGLESPMDAVGRIAPRPVLLIQGEEDPLTLAAHARPLAEGAGKTATLLMLPAAGHCDAAAVDPTRYWTAVHGLLDQISPRISPAPAAAQRPSPPPDPQA